MKRKQDYYLRHREEVLDKLRAKRLAERLAKGCGKCGRCGKLLSIANLFGYCHPKGSVSCLLWAMMNVPGVRETVNDYFLNKKRQRKEGVSCFD